MQQEAGEDRVERTGGKGQPVIIDRDGGAHGRGARRKFGCRISLDHSADFAGTGKFIGKKPVMAAKIETQWKVTPHQLKALAKTTRGLAFQKVISVKTGRRTAAVVALRTAVEQPRDGRSFTHDGRTFGEPD